jgi:hypothetical protein
MPIFNMLNNVSQYAGMQFLINRLCMPLCITLKTVSNYTALQYLKQRLSLCWYAVP